MDEFFKDLITEFQFPIQNPVLLFSILLFIILLSPIILRKMRIPAIIGLIISGIIIGPKGLWIIGENTMAEEGSINPGMELDKMNENYNDISSTAINAGVETIQKIGREVGNIFKKSSSKKSK